MFVLWEKWYEGRGERRGERVRCASLLSNVLVEARETRSVGKNTDHLSPNRASNSFHSLSSPFFDVLCLMIPPFRADNKYILHCTCTLGPMTLLAATAVTPDGYRRRFHSLSTMTHRSLCTFGSPSSFTTLLHNAIIETTTSVKYRYRKKCISFWIHQDKRLN